MLIEPSPSGKPASKRRLSSIAIRAKRAYRAFPGVAITQTRLITALVVLVLVHFNQAVKDPAPIYGSVLAYILFTIALGAFFSTVLQHRRVRKRIRALPNLWDLLAISFLVRCTGGIESAWFLLYLFPLMSASRYLGAGWSVGIAAFSMLVYGYVGQAFEIGNSGALFVYLLRALSIIGVALTAANIAKTRDRAEAKLVSAIEKIDHEILNNTDFKQVMHIILEAATEATDSDLSAMVLVGDQPVTGAFAASKVNKKDDPGGWGQNEGIRLVKEYSRPVLQTGQPLAVPELRVRAKTLVTLRLASTADAWPARLVRLESDGKPLGVLGVFSRSLLHHYTRDDLRKLSILAPLVAIAQKNAKYYQKLASYGQESKARLQILYDIAGELKLDQGIDQVFEKVVELVCTRLGSEEAALFTPEAGGARLRKASVFGPDEVTKQRLKEIELGYYDQRSLTGEVFKTKESRLENKIPPEETYTEEYSKRLPSGMTLHYLGAPLLINNEVLGVIRVLNKKAEGYSLREGEALLDERGFDEDDRDLLTMIATQVAAAIRSAKFIERNRYFEELVYKSPDPIIVVNKHGKIQNFNKECEKIWGRSEEEVLGQPVAGFYVSEAHAKDIKSKLWHAPGHTIRDIAAEILHADGITIIPIRLSATLFLDKDGYEAGSIGIFKDEREIRRLEEEKMRAAKLAALGKLAQTTAHDIKHDLGAIRNYVKGLEASISDPLAQQALSGIREATGEALTKLRNMLMTATSKPPEMRIVSLKSFLVEFESGIATRLESTGIVFISKYPEGDPLLLADVDQIRQVLSNLLGNSMDAIEASRIAGNCSGKIDLTIEIEGYDVVLTWCDDGCGMSQQDLETAFTAFCTTKETGNGLGLFITKTIVQSHRGQITVQPRRCAGICFRITLPLYAPDHIEAAVPAQSESVPERASL